MLNVFLVKFHNIRAIILFTGCTSGAIASRICGEQSSGSKSAATTEISATNSVSLIVFVNYFFIIFFSYTFFISIISAFRY